MGGLFAGIGGVCLGFESASVGKEHSYRLVWANDFDYDASLTYRHNFGHSFVLGDIRLVLVGDSSARNVEGETFEALRARLFAEPVDVLTGGFPCQAFSVAGLREGFNDERGNLFWSVVEYVRQHDTVFGRKPSVVFLENVKNLANHDGGRTFAVILNELDQLGYTVKYKVLNTAGYSQLPQNRERVYIVAFLNRSQAERFTFFDACEPVSYTPVERREQVARVLETAPPDEKYYYSAGRYPKYFTADGVNLATEVTERYEFYQLRRGMYVRKNQSHVCPTLTANMGTGGHNVPLIYDGRGVRKITPREALRLQGFPVGGRFELPAAKNGRPYPDSALYKQAGNSVSVPVAELLATEVLKAVAFP